MMALRRRILVVLVAAAALFAQPFAVEGQGSGFNSALPLTHVDNAPNSAWAQQQHYVVLVSLDGFRWDYAARDHAEHLLALGEKGAWAPEGMLPSYPSVTFPNHITLVTGLYPEHHGIVANEFYDPARKATYAMKDKQAVTDGTWYSGTPLWSLAESQGMHAAVLLWPGSEAEIAGYRPTWYAKWDSDTANSPAAQQARIDNAVALLKLPPADRPHFIAIYYPEPDHEGHESGPDSAATRKAVLKMDAEMGKLKAALDTTGLPVDFVVVSDHGMAREQGAWINLDSFTNLMGFQTAGSLLYAADETDRVRVYNQLKKASSEFAVYRLKDVPPELNYNQNPREGDPVIVATGPYAIRASAPEGRMDHAPSTGMHGFDPAKVPEMKASFFAAGPDILPGKTVAPFENVNLYPWMAHMLGLEPAKNDGNLNILAGTLRDNGADQDKQQ
jgi:predicted AlkP superfamily pyrophosphatase or phosphodiesterase